MPLKATHERWGNLTIVFRVMEVDLGEFESNAITLELLQDRWAVDYTAPDGVPFPPVIGPNNFAESPIAFAEEAPRFWQSLAVQIGQMNDPDSQRLWYWAKAQGANTGYRGGILINAQPVVGELIHQPDTGRVKHSGTFQVAEGYSKQNDPYDTGSGIRIRNLVGWTPAVATAADIRAYGVNIIYINGELLAYEDFTDEGGGEYYLTPLWRGLAGTVPRDHAEEDGYGYVIDPLNAMKAIGTRGMVLEDTVDARVSGVTPAAASPFFPAANESDLTIRKRTLLPGTPADLRIGYGLPLGAYTTPGKYVYTDDLSMEGMVVEGLDFTFKGRDRTDTSLRRGDAAAQAQPDSGTTFEVVVFKDDGTEVIVASGSTDIDEYDQVSMADAGCGTWDVGVRSSRDIAVGAGTETLKSWQTPTIEVVANEFRNLLMSWMFQGGAFGPYWVEVNGDPTVGNNGPSFISQYVSCGDSSGEVEYRQTVEVTGWRPANMRALVEFYTKQVSDTDDTVTVTLETLDDGSAQVDVDTYGPTAPATTWSKQEAEIAVCDPTTDKLRVTVNQTAAGELDSVTSGVVSELWLMLGQFTNELLSNGSFESGLTGWTTIDGGFTDTTSNAKIGTHRIQGNANVTNSVYQEVAIPTGYQHGWAVLKGSIYHPGPSINGTGSLIVQARNGAGGTVVATNQFEFQPSVDGAWFPLLAYCDIPHEATHIRVILQADRLSGTSNEISFDDVSLRIHKFLLPEFERTYRMSPTVQELPRDAQEWATVFPTVSIPRLGMFSPTGEGNGNEPPVELRGTTRIGQIHGLWTSDEQTTRPAWEFRRGETSGMFIRSQTLGAFASTQSFTVRIVYDPREQNLASSSRILACRYDGFVPAGWSLGIDGSGRTVASLYSEGANVSCHASDGSYNGPGLTFAAIVYDASTDTLRVVTPHGSGSVSTASVTDILPALSQYVHGIGICYDPQGTTNDTPRTMVASVEIWDEALAVSDLQNVLWTRGTMIDVPGSILEHGLVNANAVVATVVGTDAAGDHMVAYTGLGVDVQARPVDRWGLACARNRTNKVVANVNTTTNWAVGTGTVVTLDAARGPDGSLDAVSITGDSAHYREHTFVMGAGSRVPTTFFAWADVAGNIQVQLRETDGTVIDTKTIAVTTNRKRYDTVFTGWVNGTASAVIRFIPSDTGTDRTLYLAGPFFVDQDQEFNCPMVIPVFGGSRTRYTYEALGLPVQWNHEGEIEMEVRAQGDLHENGTLIDLNGGGANGRTIYIDNSIIAFAHYDDGASGNDSINTDETWSDDQTIRARWNQAGLLDQANAYAGVVSASLSTYGRTTDFDGTGGEIDTMSIGKSDGEGADNQSEFLVMALTLRGRESLL